MSQLLEAFGIDWRLLIAQAVNFAIVLVALTYFLYKPVLAMLAKRREVVAKGVEDARVAAETLADADGEAQARVKRADDEAKGIVVGARAAADAEKARILREAEARAAAIAADAALRAAEETARMKRETERDIARLAVLAAEKVLAGKHD